MQWNLYKCGVFRIQCSKRLQSVGGKYVAACLEDAKLIRTLQIDGFALAWNTVLLFTREHLWNFDEDMEWK